MYKEFYAQSFNLQALYRLYADIEKRETQLKPDFIPIVILLAFSVEAYINSVGSRTLTIWDEIERLPWRKKVEILHKTAGKKPAWGSEPLQFATEVFRLRDKLAHGQTEKIKIDNPESRVDWFRTMPKWLKDMNRQWILDAKSRFHDLMVYIGCLVDFEEFDYLSFSTSYDDVE